MARTLLVGLGLLAGPARAVEVAVDVGHSLRDGGAISARGRAEYDFNRELAGRVVGELRERGLAVRPINADGRIESLAARTVAADGADFFLSIHHDSLPADRLLDWTWEGRRQTYNDEHGGFALFLSRRGPDPVTSLRCASAIGALLRRAGFAAATHHGPTEAGTERPYADETNAVRYFDNLVVLYRTTVPAVLLEAGLIKNRVEELALRDAGRQQRMASAVATGIAACLAVPS